MAPATGKNCQPQLARKSFWRFVEPASACGSIAARAEESIDNPVKRKGCQPSQTISNRAICIGASLQRRRGGRKLAAPSGASMGGQSALSAQRSARDLALRPASREPALSAVEGAPCGGTNRLGRDDRVRVMKTVITTNHNPGKRLALFESSAAGPHPKCSVLWAHRV